MTHKIPQLFKNEDAYRFGVSKSHGYAFRMRMNEIVGDWLRGYRVEHGLTLDQIADASHRYGSSWNNVNVLRMEKGGSKADALPTLMVLLATLNDLTGDNLTLADVFTDYAGTVDIGDYATSYENVVSALQGDAVSFKGASDDRLRLMREEDERLRIRELEEHPEWAEFIAEEKERLGDDVQFGKHFVSTTRPPMFATSEDHTEILIVANHLPTAAEARLERRMYDADEVFTQLVNEEWIRKYYDYEAPVGLAVAAVCDVLYGHSLDEEAAKRAGEGATPQKRGRVTRVLAGEILDYMRKAAAKLED